MKLFMYYYGTNSNELVSKKKKELDKLGIEYEIGPSDEEHQYLLNNSKYYSESFKNKKYAMCSDVWRIYKMNRNKGIYADFFCEIKKINFDEKHNYFFLEIENYNVINTIFVINKHLNSLQELEKYYNKTKKTYLTGPELLTKFLIKGKDINFSIKPINDDVIVLNSNIFDNRSNKSEITINSTGSWLKKKNNSPMDYWYRVWDTNNKSSYKHKIKKILGYKFYPILYILMSTIGRFSKYNFN